MLEKYLPLRTTIFQQFTHFRLKRLLQITAVTLAGLLVALVVASGTTQLLLLAGCIALSLAGILALKQQALLSAYVLLWSMVLMLSALAYMSGGIRDLALLGYPGVLVFAAILGSAWLFRSLLIFILLFCATLTWLTLNGDFQPVLPVLGWQHLVFVAVILLLTGYSVYLLVTDMRQLMAKLQRENEKVITSRSKIERLAHHDLLTDLPNRILGEQLYYILLRTCRSQQQQLAVLFLDLDNFKPVNDSLGHSAGDMLLQQLATRLLQTLEPGQRVIRFGGDEFLFLIPNADNPDTLASLASAIITETCKPFTIMQTQVEVSGSIGIAVAPQQGVDFTVICRKADLAMYKAKENGRNTFCFYDDSLAQADVDKFNLLQRLRQGVKEQQFALHYQPQIDLKTGHIIAVEALLRWPQADGSMISPADFIPLAESSGLIKELGAWVLVEACQACARLRQQGFSHIRMAVNLSYVQFKNARLPQHVQHALQQAQLPASALELELTESLLIGETDNIRQQLDQLSKLGLTFAIDDFGTGYSNLSYLRRFNATTLKIDRSFISRLCESERDEPLVRAIIQMAASLGLKTVAEGVENKTTLACLQQMGCNEGQGFYWAPALSEDKLVTILIKQS